ncbi:MAG TPA: BamA/TamA family outer membrane protein [Lunatimonas sp.]|nr:BamA/TamA family outer membrane protein [Lunatimonas sp.]
MCKVTLILLLVMAPGMNLWAQEIPEKSNGGTIEGLFDFADEVINLISRDSWTFIPAVTYSPETSLGLGIRALKLFRPANSQDSITRPSSLPITFLYTLNKQAFVTTELNLWMRDNSAYLNTRFELSDYPFRFYGIGNNPQTDEVYATRYAYFHINYEKRLAPGLYLGPRYEFRIDDIYEKLEQGLLASGVVAGSDGQLLSGLGLVLNYDTRDNIFQPGVGVFHQLSYMTFQRYFGSNFTFSQYQLDLRKYIEVRPTHILVGQAWLSFTAGNPPFQHVSLIGGSDRMRGFFEGKYRDLHAMVYQTEYRLPVYRNLGLVVFGNAGQVAPTVKGFSIQGFKYGGGVGFRYKLNDEGLNIRLDIGVGDQRAFYFGLNEVI